MHRLEHPFGVERVQQPQAGAVAFGKALLLKIGLKIGVLIAGVDVELRHDDIAAVYIAGHGRIVVE